VGLGQRRGGAGQPGQAPYPGPTVDLGLIGGFSLRRGGTLINLPISAQRLIAFVALSERPAMRSHIAGTFWPDVTEGRAMANLRSVLWRLRSPDGEILLCDRGQIELRREVVVDVHRLSHTALAILETGQEPDHGAFESLLHSGELLPDWSDEWVLIERERYHQLRLHGLEWLCRELAAGGRFGLAVDACLAALAAEPLRESAQRQLIEVYLSEGNRVEALRQFASYERVIREEVGVEPSPEISELVRQGTAAKKSGRVEPRRRPRTARS